MTRGAMDRCQLQKEEAEREPHAQTFIPQGTLLWQVMTANLSEHPKAENSLHSCQGVITVDSHCSLPTLIWHTQITSS